MNKDIKELNEIENEEILVAESESEKTDYIWLLSCVIVTALGTFLRFFWLELKPLHHDEGVNGYFLTTLFREGIYKYDPANYHGPDLYYLALVVTKTFGLNTLSIRSSVAIFGVLTVVLAFCLRKYIGKTGSLFAALFIAVSPGMTYISRYFIHEILFVFFSFGIVISILFFIEKRKAGIWAIAWTSLLLLICFLPSTLNLANQLGTEGTTLLWILRGVFFAIEAALVFFVVRMLLGWNDGQPLYLMLASANVALLFATKETGFITIGTMLIACICVWLWRETTYGRGVFLYLETLRNYANFSERASKSEFWTFVLFHLIFSVVAIMLDNVFKTTAKDSSIGLIYSLYSLATLIPTLAAQIRRLHDIDKSGLYIFLSLIPIIGNIFLLMLLATKGDLGKNKYGVPPTTTTSQFFTKNKFWFFAIPSLLVILAVLVEYKRFYEFYHWLGNEFLPLDDTNQTLVFYSILALIFVAFLSWLVILFAVKPKTVDVSEIAEPVALTWSNLREKLTASDNWEYLLTKTAIGSIVIFSTWLFVRIGVELLVAWKSKKGVAVAWNALVFGKVDYAILGFGFVFLIIAIFIWKFHKPAKISSNLWLMGIAATFTFLYVGALFFSSFFTYAEGLQGAFKAYAIWTKTGNTDHTQNGTWAYIKWGMKIESPILILSTLGFLIALVKARHRFALFAGFWAFGLFAAYTIIPYKTPWLALSFLLPMCIIAGYAINELMKSRKTEMKILGGVSAVLATGILAFQSYDINFVRYDDDSMPYIYAHTKRGFLDLIKQIEYYADKSGKGKEATIEIVSPDYWSMPWYMNEYPKANFHGKIVDANTSEMIVAKKDDQEDEIVEKYAAHYKYVGEYPLRPGVELLLLVRKDLADSDAKDIYEMFGEPLLEMNQQPNLPVQKDSPIN